MKWPLCMFLLFCLAGSPVAAQDTLLPTLGRHVIKIGEEAIDRPAVEVIKRTTIVRLGPTFNSPPPIGARSWSEALRADLEREQLGYVKRRIPGQILDANTRMVGAIIGGSLGASGGPAGIALGASLGDRAGSLLVEHAFGDPMGKARDAYHSKLTTIIGNAVGQATVAQRNELTHLAAQDDYSGFSQKLLEISNTALDSDILNDLAPNSTSREKVLRNAFGNQVAALALINFQATQAAVDSAKRDFKTISSEFRKFEKKTERRLAALKAATDELKEHQAVMSSELGALRHQANATAEDVRFLLDASFGNMSIADQVTALRRGTPSSMPVAERQKLADKLQRVQKLQEVGNTLGIMHDMARTVSNIGSVIGLDQRTQSQVNNLANNLQTAQQAMALFTAFVTPGGGFFAAFSGLGALTGSGGGMSPDLSKALGDIKAALDQIKQQLEDIARMQRETLERLETIRLQMASDRDQILASIENVVDAVRDLGSAVEDSTRQAYSECQKIALARSAPAANRVTLSLTERESRRRNDAGAFKTCLDWLKPSLLALRSTDGGSGGTHNLPYFLANRTAADVDTSRRAPSFRDMLYRSMADYSLALLATPSETSTDVAHGFDCHLRLFAAAAAAPMYLGMLPPFPLTCPRPGQGDEDSLPIGQWRPSSGLPDVRAFSLLDAPLNEQSAFMLAEIVLRLGEWRAVMSRSFVSGVVEYAVLSQDQAFGGNGTAPHAGLWLNENHDELVRNFGDIVDIGIAREAILSGSLLTEWATATLFGKNSEELPNRLAAEAFRDNTKRAWDALTKLQDNQTLSKELQTWFASVSGGLTSEQRAANIRIVDVARMLFGERAYTLNQSHVLENPSRLASLQFTLSRLGFSQVVNPTDAERAYLRNLSWMTDLNRAADGQIAKDLVCRSRPAEERVSATTNLDTRSDYVKVRGARDDDRIKYLLALQSALSDGQHAYLTALCLMTANSLFRENVLRRAITQKLAASGRPLAESVKLYAAALDSEDGELLRNELFKGWPLYKSDQSKWFVGMRTADARQSFHALPSATELSTSAIERVPVVNTPSFDAFVRTRQLLAQQVVMNTPRQRPADPTDNLVARAIAANLILAGEAK